MEKALVVLHREGQMIYPFTFIMHAAGVSLSAIIN